MAEEVKSGMLLKRSVNKSVVSTENYKNRVFILDKKFLRYFDGDLDKRGKEKGKIPLAAVKCVEYVDDGMLDNRKNVFQVVYKENIEFLTLYIVADSPHIMEAWVNAIRQEALTMHASFLPKYHRGVWSKKQRKYNCCDQRDRSAPGCAVATSEQETSNHTTSNRKVSLPATLPPPPVASNDSSAGNHYIAVYDYKPEEKDDLELVTGEEYEILDDSKEHWWKAKNKQGKKGYIPSNYVKKKFDLEIYDWYYKEVTRQRAESILKDEGREGCFLVRDSNTTPGLYTLSVFTNEGRDLVRHYHIKKTANGEYYISEKHAFPSIPEVIYYHKHNSGGLIIRLREPPQRTSKPSTAGFGHNKWEIDPADLIISEQLGSGCFGTVHKGLYKEVTVAVKQMKEGTMSEDAFIEEAQTMTQLSHPNLVQLYGVITRKRPLCIITELMQYGALHTYLNRHKTRLREQVSALLDMCIQVCKGMAYLEQRKFIHRDLAARNCLVGTNKVVKVADFGLTRYVIDDDYISSLGTKFPVKWSPPEVLNYSRFSSKSDVWAYGILMWEIFSCGETPYNGMRNLDVVEMVMAKRRLQKPSPAPEKIYFVMKHCWEEDPDRRPTFKDLVKNLEGLAEGGNYPDISAMSFS